MLYNFQVYRIDKVDRSTKKIHNKHNVVQNSHGIVRQGYTVSFFVTALVSALYNSDVGIVLKRPGDKEFRGFAERLLIGVK